MERRRLLCSLAATAAAGTVAGGLAGLGAARLAQASPLALRPQQARYAIRDPITENMVSLSPDAPPPVIRMRQGEAFAADLTNGLPDYTTMHWHGIRLPNGMDGVPYLTQFPIARNETFRYRFTPEDAGTYWYHPHCMTMEQMARGLTGILVVEERELPRFDADIPLNLRDFRLRDDGQFARIFTAKGAARGGTRGNVLTANWRTDLVEAAPAGGLVRLRLVATDPTRTYRIALPGLQGEIIAVDGHPLERSWPLPTRETPFRLGPGQRIDVAVRMPDEEGRSVAVEAMLGKRVQVLARLRSTGASLGRDLRERPVLPANPLSVPDLKAAEVHDLVLGWTPDGDGQRNGFCGSSDFIFWSINRTPWPGDAVEGTGPLVDMKLGRSYRLRLRNESPNHHPIHLHGLTFRVLSSDKHDIVPHWTDTVLVGRNETVEIAVVADNPGDWAFHCHVIEHQKTGLAGFVRVS